MKHWFEIVSGNTKRGIPGPIRNQVSRADMKPPIINVGFLDPTPSLPAVTWCFHKPWFPISERKLLCHIKLQFTVQSFPSTLSLFELTLYENNFYKILPLAWTNMMCPFFVLECMVLSVLSIFGRWSARTTFSSLAQVWWDIFTIWLQGLNLKIIQWSHEYFQ